MRRTVRVLPFADLTTEALGTALNRYGVVCIRDCRLDDKGFVRLVSGFGAFLMVSEEYRRTGFRKLDVVPFGVRDVARQSDAQPERTNHETSLSYTSLLAVSPQPHDRAAVFLDMRERVNAIASASSSRSGTPVGKPLSTAWMCLDHSVSHSCIRHTCIRHTCEPGDFVIWNNRIMLHLVPGANSGRLHPVVPPAHLPARLPAHPAAHLAGTAPSLH